MKKLTLLGLLFVSMLGYSQDVKTTEEEYDYMKVGYWDSVNNHTALKDGYTIEPLVEKEQDSYKYDYKMFVRTKGDKCVGVIIGVTTKTGEVYHTAMPFNDMKLFKDYMSIVSSFDKELYSSYMNFAVTMGSVMWSRALNQ